MARTFNIQMILGAVDKASPTLTAVGKNMAVIGAAVSAATALMMKSWADAGDEIEKMSRRVGVSATTLSEFKHAAELSGAGLDDVEKGMKKMSKTLVDAEDGMAEYIRAFEAIGLESSELMKLEPEKQFIRISEAIADLESPTLRAAAAQDIFGRAGTKLLPMFDSGSEGLKKMRKEAHKLGIVFDEAGAKQAAEFTDNMLRLKGSMRGVFLMLAEQLFPTIDKFLTQTKDSIVKSREWMQENKELTEIILKVVVGVGALMTVLGPLMLAIPTLATSFGILNAVMAANPYAMVALAIAGVTLAIEGMIGASIKAKAAALDATEKLRKSAEGRIKIAKKEADEIEARLIEMIAAKKTQTDKYIELESKWQKYLIAIKYMEGQLLEELLEKEKGILSEKVLLHGETLTEINELAAEHYATQSEINLEFRDNDLMLMDEYYQSLEEKSNERLEKERIATESLKALGQNLIAVTSSGFVDMFKSIGKGGDSFSKGMKKMWGGMTDAVINSISQQMAAQLAQWLMIKIFKTKEAQAKAVAAHANIPFVGLAIGLGIAAAMAAAIRGFAEGGVAKGLALVGERGPELINVGSPSRIFSNPETERILAGGRGLTIYNTFTGNTIMTDRDLDDFSEMVGDKIYEKVRMEQNI